MAPSYDTAMGLPHHDRLCLPCGLAVTRAGPRRRGGTPHEGPCGPSSWGGVTVWSWGCVERGAPSGRETAAPAWDCLGERDIPPFGTQASRGPHGAVTRTTATAVSALGGVRGARISTASDSDEHGSPQQPWTRTTASATCGPRLQHRLHADHGCSIGYMRTTAAASATCGPRLQHRLHADHGYSIGYMRTTATASAQQAAQGGVRGAHQP
jgi:hypothetical protein